MSTRTAAPVGRQQYLLVEGGRQRLAYAAVDGDRTWVHLDGVVHVVEEPAAGGGGAARHDDERALAAPMPATVVAVAVAPGDRVSRGDLLVTLEAMKMELPITAPRDGTVRAVACRPGDLVQPGTALVEID